MLHKLNCTCGRPIEFMEYHICKGILPMVKVGCPDCKIKFFVSAEEINVEELPHMMYDDWFRLTKWGNYNIRGGDVP